MALAPASTDFIGAIRDALLDAGMLKDQLVVLDPNTRTPTDDYDPHADTGGLSAATLVLGPRPAYFKALQAAALTEAGLLQGIVDFRIQFIPEPGDPVLQQGMVIRALPGGDNPALARFGFQVLGVENGSIAALTKVRCRTNGALLDPWSMP
ncbi:hypothetical protein [Leifsonia aquatica]|uniref:hypothetical protein n=1 Tax=Leifsonia aquatica TaxID=144185 RepID=UPI0004684B98|nr:hypothetical protein [Leifsonia aquatica]